MVDQFDGLIVRKSQFFEKKRKGNIRTIIMNTVSI